MPQLLLLPDPKPLVDRLGPEFFRQAPACPGVYLMRDSADTILYIGKAKNLRKRLAHYRVANPDRLPRRHLRLLRAVEHIELQPCASEASALAKEAALLRNVRPGFNRAGTWPGRTRYIGWRLIGNGIELTLMDSIKPGWSSCGPIGAAIFSLRGALLRLLWCAVHCSEGVQSLPEGWFRGHYPEEALISKPSADPALLETLKSCLDQFFSGSGEPLIEWVRERTASQQHAFEVAAREADLEIVSKFKPPVFERL